MTADEHVPELPIGVVIVTHRSEGSLPGLLESMAVHEPGLEVVVVDNASPAPPEVPGWCRLVVMDANVGFGAAVNRGVREVASGGAEYLMVLNPDVRLQGPSIRELAAQMAGRPGVGIATGPVVDGAGRRVASAWGPTSTLRAAWHASGADARPLRRLLGRLGNGGVATSAATLTRDEVDVDGHVLGGAMMVRRACWDQLAGFDEGFFLYWEDADLCHRARRLDWRVAQLPTTAFVHVEGTSSRGVTDDRRWNWYVEGAERFAAKHLRPQQARRLLAALRWGRKLHR